MAALEVDEAFEAHRNDASLLPVVSRQSIGWLMIAAYM